MIRNQAIRKQEVADRAPDLAVVRDAWVQNYLEVSALEEEYEELFELSPWGCITVTPEGRLVRANSSAVSLLGAESGVLAGTLFAALFDQVDRPALTHAMQLADITARPQTMDLPLGRGPAKNAKWIRLHICAHLHEGGLLKQWQISLIDVTHTTKKIQQLEATLAKKEARMRELNHRLGNNLLVLSLQLRLKEQQANGDQELAEVRHQIEAMHDTQTLMRISGEQLVNVQSYLEVLLKGFRMTLEGTPVAIELSVADIALPANQAVCIGLIVNELAVNAVKHGFARTQEPRFGIRLEKAAADSHYLLEVFNTGAPFPEDLSVPSPQSSGLEIVECYVDELQGTFELERAPHPVFRIRFPASQESAQVTS